MQACGKRAIKSILSLACLSVFAWGCDTDTGKADKNVQALIKESSEKRTGNNEANIPAAISLLEKAIGEAAASAGAKAVSRSALGQAEMDSANLSLRKLDDLQNQIGKVTLDIHQLISQISTSNTLIAGYQKLEPSAAIAEVNKQLAEARGSADKPWFTHDKTEIKTLAAIKQDISKLEGQISQLQKRIKTANDDRAKALAESAKAEEGSTAAKGQASVDLYKKGSDHRKIAADLQVKIDVDSLALVPLQRDLEIAKGQQVVLDEVIAAFEKQLADINAGWKEIQDKVTEQKGVITNLVEGSGAAPADEADASTPRNSVAEKSAYLSKLVPDAQKLRDTAEAELNDAAKHFKDATDSADQLRTMLAKNLADENLQKGPEASAWKILQQMLDPGVFRLQQGNAERAKAELYTGRAMNALARLNLSNIAKGVLDAALVKLPADLDSVGLDNELKNARDLADASFTNSKDMLLKVSDGTAPPDRKTAAHVSRMLVMYSWSRLAAAAGDKQSASELLAQAVDARNAATEGKAHLPLLPVELAPPPSNAPMKETPGSSPNAPPTTAPVRPEKEMGFKHPA